MLDAAQRVRAEAITATVADMGGRPVVTAMALLPGNVARIHLMIDRDEPAAESQRWDHNGRATLPACKHGARLHANGRGEWREASVVELATLDLCRRCMATLERQAVR